MITECVDVGKWNVYYKALKKINEFGQELYRLRMLLL